MNRQGLLHLFFAAALCPVLAGCASGVQHAPVNSRHAQLVVHNSNTRDVNLYVVNGTTRVRLGTARSMATSQLTIPATYLARSSGLVLQADPIGSAITFTFPAIHASAMDRVELQVGNALQMSTFAVYAR